MIEVDNLNFSAGDSGTTILSDISLRIAPGERVGIIGPSGSGKTTLALHLVGLHKVALYGQTTGSIKLRGRDCTQKGYHDFAGVVLQNPEIQLFGETVFEEIEISLRNRGIAEPAELVEKYLDLFGLKPVRDYRVAELSLGWKQRLSVASMLALEPDVLLLDEPTAYMDAAAADELFDILRKQAEDTGLIVIIVEHDLKRLQSWATRLLTLQEGRLVADNPASNVQVKNFQRIPTAASAARTATPLLQLQHVCYRYPNRTTVLSNVTFSVAPGEIIAVVGPNGAGKSTLLRLIKGIIKPTSGNISWHGQGQLMDGVGIVFQNPDTQLFAYSVMAECVFYPRNLGFDSCQAQEAAMRALERVGLGEYIERMPLSLSYGEKRRVTLASVIAGNPRLLCLDEPTVGLDFDCLSQLARQLRELADDGTAVILATHDELFVRSVASRVVVLRKGRIQAIQECSEKWA